MNIVTATVAGQSFQFTLMDDDGDVLVCRQGAGFWREAFPFFSINFEDDQYTTEELHAIADKIRGVVS